MAYFLFHKLLRYPKNWQYAGANPTFLASIERLLLLSSFSIGVNAKEDNASSPSLPLKGRPALFILCSVTPPLLDEFCAQFRLSKSGASSLLSLQPFQTFVLCYFEMFLDDNNLPWKRKQFYLFYTCTLRFVKAGILSSFNSISTKKCNPPPILPTIQVSLELRS